MSGETNTSAALKGGFQVPCSKGDLRGVKVFLKSLYPLRQGHL